MVQRWVGVLVVVLCVYLGGAPPTRAHQPEGTLTVAVATFGGERWLPSQYVGAEDIVLKPLYDNLLSRDPQTGALTPLLAERWEMLEGGKAWRFHLRPGVPFHDGHGEVTAHDVQFTFAQIAKEGSVNALAPEFRRITRMDVSDSHTITLYFDAPFVTFGHRVTQGLYASVAYIQPQQYTTAVGEAGVERHPVGTGPWRFVEHVRGQRIVYEAIANHWRVVPHFQRLVFLRVPDPATRIAMLRAGDADVIEIGADYAEALQKAGLRTLIMPHTAWVWVVLGGQWPTRPTYDPTVPWALPDNDRARKVRLALNLAVDKDAIIQQIFGGLGTPGGTVNFYPTDPWTTAALAIPLPYDPQQAKVLLAEAGYPQGFAVTMNLVAWPGRSYLPDVGEAVAMYWEQVGLTVTRRPVDRAVFAADFRTRSYAGVALAYAGPVLAPEPWELFARFTHSKAAVQLLLEHPTLDGYVDRLGTEPNAAERLRIMQEELGPWLQTALPAVSIGPTHSMAGVGPRVGTWPLIPGHTGLHNWEYVTHGQKGQQ